MHENKQNRHHRISIYNPTTQKAIKPSATELLYTELVALFSSMIFSFLPRGKLMARLKGEEREGDCWALDEDRTVGNGGGECDRWDVGEI